MKRSREYDPLACVPKDRVPSPGQVRRQLRRAAALVGRLQVLLALSEELHGPGAADDADEPGSVVEIIGGHR